MKVNVNSKQYELAIYKPHSDDGFWQVYVVIDGAERFCADGSTKSEAINTAMVDIQFSPNRYEG
jgi:hypothetical protein